MSNFIKSALVYTMANVLNKAVPFFLLPILTRYLQPSDYGIIATFLVVMSLMTVFVGLNSDGAVMVNFFNVTGREFRTYVGNVLIVVFTDFIIILGLIYVLKSPISGSTGLPKLWLFIAVLASLCQSIISIKLVIWRSEQKPLFYGFFNMSFMIANVSLSLLFTVALGWKWQGRLLGIAISLFLFGISGLIMLRKYMAFSLNKAYIKDMLFFGVPLIPHALGGWIITSVDKLFINSMVNVATTGVYTVGYQIGMIINILATSFNTAWAPFLYEKLKQDNYTTKLKIVRYTYIYCAFLIGSALCLGFISPILLSFLVGKDFYGASKYVIWIAMGYAFEGIYLAVGNYIFYAKKTYFLSIITLFSALLNLALNYVLVKKNGAIGAAQANCLTYFIFCALTWFLSSRVYKMPWSLRRHES